MKRIEELEERIKNLEDHLSISPFRWDGDIADHVFQKTDLKICQDFGKINKQLAELKEQVGYKKPSGSGIFFHFEQRLSDEVNYPAVSVFEQIKALCKYLKIEIKRIEKSESIKVVKKRKSTSSKENK